MLPQRCCRPRHTWPHPTKRFSRGHSVEATMRHEPFDHMDTNQLISMLINRIDAPNCLHSLLALMVVGSEELSIKRQYLMAGSLRDVAEMIERRPEVRDLADRLRLM